MNIIGFSNILINLFLGIANCANSDIGATDKYGKRCNEYYDSTECGKHDDEDFEAMKMCCRCGGGHKG